MKNIQGHKVVRKIEKSYKGIVWYYVCECGYVSSKRINFRSARAVLEADHLAKLQSDNNISLVGSEEEILKAQEAER